MTFGHVRLEFRQLGSCDRVVIREVTYVALRFVGPLAMTAHTLAVVGAFQTRFHDVVAPELLLMTASAFGMGLAFGCMVMADVTRSCHLNVCGMVERHRAKPVLPDLLAVQHVQHNQTWAMGGRRTL